MPHKPIFPDPENPILTETLTGINQSGETIMLPVVVEQPWTIFLNHQEIVTAMTIGDHPKWLATGFLWNQGMLHADDNITNVEIDDDLQVIVVRTKRKTNYEDKLKKKVQTSGCAQGTVFADLLDTINKSVLPQTKYDIDAIMVATKTINTMPSLYLKAGAIHGCALCQGDKIKIYVEDVGRHNAVDKIAGYLLDTSIDVGKCYIYTTGRLTSEMVLKTIRMGIPLLISRSGFTAWGAKLAQEHDLTLIGRARGKRYTLLSGQQRLITHEA